MLGIYSTASQRAIELFLAAQAVTAATESEPAIESDDARATTGLSTLS